MIKKGMSKKNTLLLLILILASAFVFITPVYADTPSSNDQDTTKLRQIGGGSSGGFEDINALVEDAIWKVRAVGALIIVIALVLGLIMLGVSMGNSARRAVGISAILCAAIGIYGVAKAPSLANWIITDAESAAMINTMIEQSMILL